MQLHFQLSSHTHGNKRRAAGVVEWPALSRRTCQALRLTARRRAPGCRRIAVLFACSVVDESHRDHTPLAHEFAERIVDELQVLRKTLDQRYSSRKLTRHARTEKLQGGAAAPSLANHSFIEKLATSVSLAMPNWHPIRAAS
eukprot:6190957-Pleurochrysis_carterae.AAC.1